MTNEFFSGFRSGFFNSDISSIHITPNWDSPDARIGTETETEGIAQEFSGYYSHLFASKPASNPERLLSKLKDSRRISDAHSKELDSPLTLQEVKKVINSIAKRKSPGPDGLGAEFYHAFIDTISEPLLQMLLESQEKGSLVTPRERHRRGHSSPIQKRGPTRCPQLQTNHPTPARL